MPTDLSLDIRTLAFIATLSAVMQGVLLAILWRTAPRSAATLLWAGGGILLALGLVCLAFRYVLPDAVTIVLANVAIAGSHGLFLLGIERYCGRSYSFTCVAVVLAASLTAFVVFGLVAPDTALRVVAISLALSLFAGASGWWLWHRDQEVRSPIDRLMALMFTAHAAFHFFRGGYTLLLERDIGDFMAASSIHALAFIDIVALSFASGIGFAVMTISGLHRSLERELAARKRLFSILAHDLRAPFGGLVNLTDLIQVAFTKDCKDEVQDLAAKLSEEARVVLALLDDLLVWGHAEIKEGMPLAELLDLATVVDSAVASQSAKASEKDITIRNALAVTSAYGVRRHAEMILRNLISNALKFSRPGSQITITSSRQSGQVVVSVIDEGIGLVPAGAEASGGDTGSRRGTAGEGGAGLGLILCRELCRHDGQRVWLSENPGGGMTGSFTLYASAPDR
ncbi:HAMP domain-containing sensor histidine kinase [Pelagibius sp. 7325]|uniref:ATP-binding protein n=1 Tax=Pelagibius sp. 7325 TaxID=3131994 RepID=UPI0030EC2C63